MYTIVLLSRKIKLFDLTWLDLFDLFDMDTNELVIVSISTLWPIVRPFCIALS